MRAPHTFVAVVFAIGALVASAEVAEAGQTVQQVGVPATGCPGACTGISGTLTGGEPNQSPAGFIQAPFSWTHVYPPIVSTITSATITIDLIDADSGSLALHAGTSASDPLIGSATGQDQGTPGPFRDLASAPPTGSVDNVIVIDSSLYPDLQDGVFRVYALDPTPDPNPNSMGAWGTNRALLTINWEDVACTENTECDDSNPCTDDVCNNLVCENNPNTNSCDDGNVCTSGDVCAIGFCLGSNNTDPCDDGDACTDGDVCAGGSCSPGGPLTCDDSNACTDDSCDSGTGCVFTNNTNPCDDGDACTDGDVCSGGACAPGGPLACDDANGCTDDSCDSGTGCVFSNNTAPCEDGDACTDGDVCAGGACTPGGPLACDDANGCTDDSCDSGTGCVFTNNTDPCDDGDACTDGDVCAGGSCAPGGPLACDDANGCTDDSCDSGTGCMFTNNTDPCDDSDACTDPDTCSGGACLGAPVDCQDGVFCNGVEGCDPGLGCQPGSPPMMDDGVACTVESCDEQSQMILHTPDDSLCFDHNDCTTDTCDAVEGCLNEFIPGCIPQVPSSSPPGLAVLVALMMGLAGLGLATRERRRR